MGEKNNAYLNLFDLLLNPGDKKLGAISMPEMTFTAKIEPLASLEEEKKETDGLPFDEPNDDECEELAFEDDGDEGSVCFHALMIPVIKSVIFNGPATTIFWVDNTKTTVKVSEGQQYDRYAGFCACVVKKLFGSSTNAKRIMNDLDLDLIRQARAAEKEALKQQHREADIQARVRKAMKSMPSFEDFQRRAYDRAVAMVVDDIAADMAKDMLKRVQTRQAAHDVPDAGEEG